MLTALRLRNFRCYPALSWEIPPEGALLLGRNAQGKTTVLEAICFGLALHSPRTARFDRLAMHDCRDFGVSLDTDEGTRRLAWQNRRLAMSVRGVPRRDYADYLADSPPAVWLGNTDMSLVTGGAEERRKYLDFLGAQWHPAYRVALREYRKALKSRNLLLRDPRRTPALLRSYADILCRHGETLRALRRQLLELLQPHVRQLHLGISGQTEQVDILYQPSTPLPLEEAFEEALAADERAGFTTIGPHRDDFGLGISGVPAAEYASEGQQRTLATALALAQASLLQTETGHAPTLLIDDIFGELDPARRTALLAQLPPDSQVFITATHLDWLKGDSPFPLMNVENGAIRGAS